MFFILLIHLSNFVLIKYYLLYDLSFYFMYNFKLQKLEFKQFINNIAIDL